MDLFRGVELQDPVDHAVEHLAGQIHRPDQLRGEVSLVEALLALKLRPILPVEIEGRDRLAPDLRDDRSGGVLGSAAAAGKEHEPEDEDKNHGEKGPLQVVEALAHRLQH